MENDILKIQEQERERLARELHDSTVQNLTHLIHRLEYVSKCIDKDPIEAKLEIAAIRLLIKDTIKETRNLIFDLRPMSIDDLGFVKSLDDFMNDFEERNSITVKKMIDDTVNELSEDILINIYRIVQEFCINAKKHSKCSTIIINISFEENRLHLYLSDDGIGCNLDALDLKRNYGLSVMKERVKILNGTLNLISSPDNGFILDAFIPIGL